MCKKPNFLIVGAAASGTSFLSNILTQHKDIYLPKILRPEPHFFYYTHKYDKGISWYIKEWFSEVREEKCIGERSSSYLYHKESAFRIKKHFPKMKLIMVLRNPIERAWGNYRYTVLNGLENLEFQDALLKEKERISMAEGIWKEIMPHDYTGRSKYGEQIQQYLSLFSWDQVLIVQSEKLNSETKKQLNRITNFLEIDSFQGYSLPPKFISLSIKDPRLQMNARNALGQMKFDQITEAIRRQEDDFDRHAESLQDKQWVSKMKRNIQPEKNKIDSHIESLLKKHFEKDQEKFFKFSSSHIDFNPWF